MPYKTKRGTFAPGVKRRAAAATVLQRAARGKILRRARGPVARIQRKPYVPQRIKNTASIATLARQVNRLQQATAGHYQKMIQSVQFSDAPDSTWNFSNDKPFCICASDFTLERLEPTAR